MPNPVPYPFSSDIPRHPLGDLGRSDWDPFAPFNPSGGMILGPNHPAFHTGDPRFLPPTGLPP